MKCLAMLFNLETRVNKEKTGVNHFMTFVDIDTGESFRTFVDQKISEQYKKMAEFEINLAVSVSEYQGRAQLNTRIIDMVPLERSALPSEINIGSVRDEKIEKNSIDSKPETKALKFG
jgi:hypothetical protein